VSRRVWAVHSPTDLRSSSAARIVTLPAYIQYPKNAKGPLPAIIDLHSHGGMIPFGKEKVTDLGAANHPVMKAYHDHVYDGQATGTALARSGYFVMSIDAFFFGERRTVMDDDLEHYGYDRAQNSVQDIEHLRKVCSKKEATLVKGLLYAGMTWQGVVHWDDIRTVDYLLSRAEVDPKRIGCNGISLGGYRSLYLASLDERIDAANVVGFMSTARSMIHSHLDTHSWVHLPPTVHRYLDLPDVVSMMAPKPLLVQQCTHDGLYPLSGMQESVAKITAIYDKARAARRFTGRFYDTTHRFTREMQADAFAFFDRHLK
jgi:dienelactone hydrolase